jgi:hypothetical protein
MLNNRGVADPVYLNLTGGTHMLTIKQREDGTKIDKLILTNDLGSVPYGVREPGEPVTIALEAEVGVLTSPMRTGTDSSASSGRYIWVPSGKGDLSNPSLAGGSAKYTFELPVGGTYLLWGLTLAGNTSDDSFYVSLDGQPYMLWDVKISQDWSWNILNNRGVADPVYLRLTPGTHTLTIKQREDGTKIDKLILTNDLDW